MIDVAASGGGTRTSGGEHVDGSFGVRLSASTAPIAGCFRRASRQSDASGIRAPRTRRLDKLERRLDQATPRTSRALPARGMSTRVSERDADHGSGRRCRACDRLRDGRHDGASDSRRHGSRGEPVGATYLDPRGLDPVATTRSSGSTRPARAARTAIVALKEIARGLELLDPHRSAGLSANREEKSAPFVRVPDSTSDAITAMLDDSSARAHRGHNAAQFDLLTDLIERHRQARDIEMFRSTRRRAQTDFPRRTWSRKSTSLDPR